MSEIVGEVSAKLGMVSALVGLVSAMLGILCTTHSPATGAANQEVGGLEARDSGCVCAFQSRGGSIMVVCGCVGGLRAFCGIWCGIQAEVPDDNYLALSLRPGNTNTLAGSPSFAPTSPVSKAKL